MSFIRQALQEFKQELQKRGHPQEIVWLQANQMWLSERKKALLVNVNYGFAYENHVVDVFSRFESDLECGAALMLVGIVDGISYCTLLLDSFGSDHDIELKEDEFFLWCDPYVKNMEFVTSNYRWKWMTFFENSELSSLDYAFTLKQAFY